MDTTEIKRQLRMKSAEPTIASTDYLSTGSTLLNLAMSGRIKGGLTKGRFFYLVGDSNSGKTWLSLTCLAEAALNEHFDEHSFVFDNAEDGALMDIRYFFGEAVADRMDTVYSDTIEDFYYNLDDAMKEGPCIYILDSMDALTSRAEVEKFSKDKKAHRSGKETTGIMTDGKAKKNSSMLRQSLSNLRDTGSILLVISQTRDNIGFGFDPKTRSGGRALRFYATIEMWSSVKQKLKKAVRGIKREVGTLCRVVVKKNRITGRDRIIELPILHSFGIDDIGSCVDYLLTEKHWTKGKSIRAPEFEYKGTRAGLIQHIEKTNSEQALRLLVGKVWREVEQACAVQNRRRRYQ